MYSAIIGDVKGSRNIENWQEFARELKRTLDEINSIFRKDILIPFEITAGDEFQGVLKSPERTPHVLEELHFRLFMRIYTGVGLGDVERGIDERTALRGSAFYRAREALESGKDSGRIVVVRSPDSLFDRTVNAIYFLVQSIQEKWTQRQREIIQFYRRHMDYTYEEIGNHFGISKQAVHKQIKSARFHAVLEGMEAVRDLFVNHERFILENQPEKDDDG